MYFQILKDMKDSIGIFDTHPELVEQFDFWLASRRTAVKNYLCPYTFSKYSGLDPELSLELFVLSSHDKFKLLRPRYDIFIASKGLNITSVYDKQKIPFKYIDPDTDIEYQINFDEDIRVYFELLQEADSKPSLFADDMGKTTGVGFTEYTAKLNTVSKFLID